MNTYLDRARRLASLILVATICLTACKDEEDSYTGPIYNRISLNRQAGILDIEFSEDGRKFCFIDAKANVGVVDLESGQLLWSRSIAPDDMRGPWPDRTWAACELLNEGGDVVAWHSVSIGKVSVVPADPDGPIMAFEIAYEWSDSDYARLSKAFVENRHMLDLSGIGGDSEADQQALQRDLDRFCQRLMSDPGVWQHPSWFMPNLEDSWESDSPVRHALMRAAERAARELVFRDRALASQLAKTYRMDWVTTSLGVVDIHGQKGVLAGSTGLKSLLSVYSPQDGHLMWWFVSPDDLELNDWRTFMEEELPREEFERVWPQLQLSPYPKLHRYVDRGTIDAPMTAPAIWDDPTGSQPNWMGVGQKNGRTYLYLGEVNMPGYNFLSVGMLENDIDVDWRTLETYGVRNFAADGFQLLVLYAEGRIALWDISEEGGGDPKLLAEGQAVESNIWHDGRRWCEDGTAVAYRDGYGVVSVSDQYWAIHRNKVEGPFTAEGRITAIAMRPPYWVYGTADGEIIFDRLD